MKHFTCFYISLRILNGSFQVILRVFFFVFIAQISIQSFKYNAGVQPVDKICLQITKRVAVATSFLYAGILSKERNMVSIGDLSAFLSSSVILRLSENEKSLLCSPTKSVDFLLAKIIHFSSFIYAPPLSLTLKFKNKNEMSKSFLLFRYKKLNQFFNIIRFPKCVSMLLINYFLLTFSLKLAQIFS